jgi:outer membrane protein assembly factor BamB
MARWVTEIGGEPVGVAVGPDGRIYAATNAVTASLFALDPDGTVAWSYAADEYIASPPSVGADGTVYFGDGLGTLYALNPDGTLNWTYALGGAFGVGGTPAIGSDGTIYVSDDNFLEAPTLYAINPDGTLAWDYSDGGRARLRVAVAADGTIYLGRDEQTQGVLVALNADGSLKWSYVADGPVAEMAIGPDGNVYFVGGFAFDGTSLLPDGKLYAVNPDGTLAWTYQTAGGGFYAPSLASDGTVYAMTGGAQEDEDQVGTLYAVTSDGTEQWKVELTGCPGNGATVGADGTVYAPIAGCVFGGVGILEAFDPGGTKEWEFEVNGDFKVILGSVPIVADGTAYFVSQLTGEVYAVKTTSLGLAASSWPKPAADNANSGRSD